MDKTFFKFVEPDTSTPKDHRSRNLTWGPTRTASSSDVGDEGEDTPRGDRPGTMEQWPEYPTANPAGAPKQTARVQQTCTPVAPVPQGQGAPCINLCNALPSVHPAHPALGPLTPAGLVYPPYPPYPVYPMATPYGPSPQIPPAMQRVPMDHLMQAQQAVALSAAATAVSLCSALAAPVLQAMPPTMLPSPILLPPQPCIPIPTMPTAPKPMEAAEQAEESQLEKRHRSRRSRLWVHIYLRMQLEGFDLVPRLIGRKGCNMRRIAEQTSAKAPQQLTRDHLSCSLNSLKGVI